MDRWDWLRAVVVAALCLTAFVAGQLIPPPTRTFIVHFDQPVHVDLVPPAAR